MRRSAPTVGRSAGERRLPYDALALTTGAALAEGKTHHLAIHVDQSDAKVMNMALNNAANVRLQLGHMEAALQLYRRALGVAQSPIVLFNLSQAHGQACQVDDLTRMLEAERSSLEREERVPL